MDVKRNKCVTKCSWSQVFNSTTKKCEGCPSGTRVVGGKCKCSWKKIFNKKTKKCEACPPGSNFDNGRCKPVPCEPKNCPSCPDPKICPTCPTPQACPTCPTPETCGCPTDPLDWTRHKCTSVEDQAVILELEDRRTKLYMLENTNADRTGADYGFDVPGGDMPGDKLVLSFADCEAACARNDECGCANWHGDVPMKGVNPYLENPRWGRCYLKTKHHCRTACIRKIPGQPKNLIFKCPDDTAQA